MAHIDDSVSVVVDDVVALVTHVSGAVSWLNVCGLTVPCVHVTINYSLSEKFSNQMLKTKECGKLRKRC